MEENCNKMGVRKKKKVVNYKSIVSLLYCWDVACGCGWEGLDRAAIRGLMLLHKLTMNLLHFKNGINHHKLAHFLSKRQAQQSPLSRAFHAPMEQT